MKVEDIENIVDVDGMCLVGGCKTIVNFLQQDFDFYVKGGRKTPEEFLDVVKGRILTALKTASEFAPGTNPDEKYIIAKG